MHDVLIAGGGPAGAIVALVLARAGARVTVFDRAAFPRDKLCGDTLNPGALAILRRLGVAHVADAGLPIDGMIVTGEPAVRVEARYGDGVAGCALTRRVLDDALIRAAAAAGARVEERVVIRGPLVEEIGSQRHVRGVELAGRAGQSQYVHASLVIAADGRHSRIARALGIARYPAKPRRWAVGAYFEGVHGLTAYGEMHVRSGQYIGVAPVPGGAANVCVVTAQRDALRQPAALLNEVVNRDPQLAPRFADARLIARPVAMGPLAVECDVPGVPGMLLAGDAAGFIDPMTGDGLRFALRGAELAAAEALRALECGPAEAHLRLHAARRREFARKWRFNTTLRSLVDMPAALAAAARAATLVPAWLRYTIRYAGDLHAA